MNPTLRALQRHVTVIYLAFAALLLVLLLSPQFPEPTLVITWALAQGIGIVWIGSGAWDDRERWAVRFQATFTGLAILIIIAGQPENVASAGLLVFMVAIAFFHIAHTVGRFLSNIQTSLVTIPAFARVEAARQALFYATFAAPIAMAAVPGPLGIAFVAVSCVLVSHFARVRTRRRLLDGVSRQASE